MVPTATKSSISDVSGFQDSSLERFFYVMYLNALFFKWTKDFNIWLLDLFYLPLKLSHILLNIYIEGYSMPT